MTPETALAALFCELFSADALRKFLRFDPRCSEISNQLPPSPANAGEVHRRAVALLGDAGLIDRELFARIAKEFPAQHEEIRHVEKRWVDTDGKQQRPAAPTAAPTPVAVPPGGPGALQLIKVVYASDGPAGDIVRFEILALNDCIVHWCGVSAAKVIPRDATWTIWPHQEARLRREVGLVDAGEVIAVLTDTGTSTVQTMIAQHPSQLVRLASDGALVPAGETVAVLDVSIMYPNHGILIDVRGSDFGGVLRWQPVLTHPVWLESFSEPSDLTAVTFDCDNRAGLHVVCSQERGVIVDLSEDMKPGGNVERNQVLCQQQVKDQRIAVKSPMWARVEEIHVRAGSIVSPNDPLVSLRHAPARPQIQGSIDAINPPLLFLIRAPVPGIFLGPHLRAAKIPVPGQPIKREEPLCTILGPGGVPCDVFADIYGSVTRVLTRPGEGRVRRGQPLLEVRIERYFFVAPYVGTYYKAPEPGGVPFIYIGKRVQRGDVLCIIEALKEEHKFMSEVDGVVEKLLVKNADPVEFRQALIIIRVDD